MQQFSSKFSWTKHIDFMIIDSIVLGLAFWFSYSRVFGTPFFWYDDDWVRYLVFVLVLNVVITFLTNPYSGILRRPYYMELVRSFQLTITNALAATFMFYLLKVGALYSRGTSLYMYGLFFVFSALLHVIWKKLLLSGKVVIKTAESSSLFIIGNVNTIHKVINNVVAGDFVPYTVSGIHLVDDARNSGTLGGQTLIGDEYVQYILDNNIRQVLVSVPMDSVEKGALEQLNANAVELYLVVESTLGFQPEDQYFMNVGVYKTLGLGAFSFKPSQMIYLGFKRLMDILFGLLGLVVLIPVTIFVKLSFLLSHDTASIFYRQTRVGKNGKEIRIWKYRSMVPNADEVLQELLKDEAYRKEWDENQKFEHDPRITKVGNVLRKTSLDELPQLLNVLTGDMSLVGPRPLVVGELEKFGGLKLYQRVKPGITGWWACNGRSNIGYRERLELEYYYVKNCSITLDVLCILRTILAVVKKDGAK